MQSVDRKSWITLTPSCPLPLFQVCTCIVSCGGEAAGWSTLLLRNLCWERKQKEQQGQIKSLQEAHAGMVAADCNWSECWESHRIGIFFSVILGSASIVSSSSCTINVFQCLTMSNTSMLEAPKMLGSDKRFVSNLNNCKTQLICWVNHHNEALNLTSNGRCLQLKTSPVHVEQEFSAALSVDSCWFLCRWGSCHSSAPKDSYIGFVQTWGW